MFSLAPQLVVGNLRLTATGVFAEYLLSGVPFIFLSEEWQNTAAADHGELWRALPSGSSVSGLHRARTRSRDRPPDAARPSGTAQLTRATRAPRPGCGTAACGNPPSARAGRGGGSTG